MKTLFYFELRVSAGMIENLETRDITLIPTTFRSTKMFKNVGIYKLHHVSLWSSSVYLLNVVNDARIHSSLKAKDFVQWPTCIYVFRCKILWSFVDAYFPPKKTVHMNVVPRSTGNTNSGTEN